VSVYLDVNVLVALFVADPLSVRADAALRGLHDRVVISNLAAAEFSSVIARRVRTRDLRAAEAGAAFSNFDSWCSRYAQIVTLENGDVTVAIGLMRRLEFPLRTPDALHVALVQRTGSMLLSFDAAMINTARTLGIGIAKG
jgi:predicted nucleic acid-binding protein